MHMGIIEGLLDRVVLVGGVLCGGTAPSFIAQYRQRVGGHLDQVLQDLLPFQQIANLRHGGSLEALVQHHLRSTDATFRDEGAAIQAMMTAAQRLRAAYEGLNGSLFEQSAFMAVHAQPELLRATWQIYEPSFALSVQGLVFAASVGIVVWLAFLGLWFLLSMPFRRRTPKLAQG